MGGFVRRIFRAVTSMAAPVQVAQAAPVQAAATAAADTKKKTSKFRCWLWKQRYNYVNITRC